MSLKLDAFSDILPGMLSVRLGEFSGTLKTRDFLYWTKEKLRFDSPYDLENMGLWIRYLKVFWLFVFVSTRKCQLPSTASTAVGWRAVFVYILPLGSTCWTWWHDVRISRKKKKYHWNICIYILIKYKKQNGFLMILYDCVLKTVVTIKSLFRSNTIPMESWIRLSACPHSVIYFPRFWTRILGECSNNENRRSKNRVAILLHKRRCGPLIGLMETERNWFGFCMYSRRPFFHFFCFEDWIKTEGNDAKPYCVRSSLSFLGKKVKKK